MRKAIRLTLDLPKCTKTSIDTPLDNGMTRADVSSRVAQIIHLESKEHKANESVKQYKRIYITAIIHGLSSFAHNDS